MSQLLNILQETLLLNKLSFHNYPRKGRQLLQHGSCSYPIKSIQLPLQGGLEVVTHVKSSHKEKVGCEFNLLSQLDFSLGFSL